MRISEKDVRMIWGEGRARERCVLGKGVGGSGSEGYLNGERGKV